MKKKRSESTRGTDESFLKLMTLSGSSLLKLLGVPSEQADQYQFRSVTLKEKTLMPDVEAIPMLDSEQGPVFIEFQAYHDPFIRYRLIASVYQGCAQQRYNGSVIAGVVYTDSEYQKAALPLNTALTAVRGCQIKSCFKEVVLTDYTEQKLLKIDPKLTVLAPFTLPVKTEKVTLFKKSQKWCDRIAQVFPTHQQREALDILGLFVLNRFRDVTYEEVVAMLNFDLMESVAGKQVYDMGYEKGAESGEERGERKGEQKMVLEALEVRFGAVPDLISKQIQKISQQNVLSDLLRQAIQCQTVKDFKKTLSASLPKTPKRK